MHLLSGQGKWESNLEDKKYSKQRHSTKLKEITLLALTSDQLGFANDCMSVIIKLYHQYIQTVKSFQKLFKVMCLVLVLG